MTKIGPIKKERAIFNAIRMRRPSYGQERDAPLRAGARTHLQPRFITGSSRLNKQVRPLFRSQGNHCAANPQPRRTIWCCPWGLAEIQLQV